jgi:hypothetical protein
VEQIDITDFKTIESKIKQIIEAFPTLDIVCVFSGKLEHLSFMDPSTSTDESIISETTLNLTSPSILARHFIPHLLTLKQPAKFRSCHFWHSLCSIQVLSSLLCYESSCPLSCCWIALVSSGYECQHHRARAALRGY